MIAGERPDASESFADEVTARLGVLPNFFRAPTAAGLLDELWAFAKSSYLDNPTAFALQETPVRAPVPLLRGALLHRAIRRFSRRPRACRGRRRRTGASVEPGHAAAIIISRHQENEERLRVEERQKVLIAELQHRIRNLMGVIHSMADKTARTSVNLGDFHDRFNDRLVALLRVPGNSSSRRCHTSSTRRPPMCSGPTA
ncbi:HWE histidine kinase domain-containing protein [Dyella jiangningensis]